MEQDRNGARVPYWSIAAIFGAVLFNPWTVGRILTADGRIDHLGLASGWILINGLLAALGIAGMRHSRRWVFRLAPLLGLITIAWAWVAYGVVRAPVPQADPPQPHELLDRALRIDEVGEVQLAQRTMHLAHGLHDRSTRLTRTVPADGRLDLAYGVDPLLRRSSDGTAVFRLKIEAEGTPEMAIERRLSLGDPRASAWHDETIDLTSLSGREVELELTRSLEGSAQPIRAFDLRAEDFLYWSRPELRPRDLPQRLNVVLISIDTLRADHLGYHGYRRTTSPNLDRWADRGIVLERCLSQSPWTTPSHFSILTGLWPHRHGADEPIQNLRRRWSGQYTTAARAFRDAGYVTAAFTGTGPISAKFGFADGFGFYDETPSDTTDVAEIVQKARAWLAETSHRSFFLFLHTYEPHAPYVDTYFQEREGIEDSAGWEAQIARYDGDIRKADHHLGLFLADLERLGIAENTLVVVTSDHGEELDDRLGRADWVNKRHGHSLYDEQLHVPLVFVGLDAVEPGRRIGVPVRSVDILPTILDYAGLPMLAEIDGRSLRGLIEGTDEAPREVLAEATTYGTRRAAVRTPKLKYVRRLSYGQLTHPSSAGLPLTPQEELYYLPSDPEERDNRASDDLPLLEQARGLFEQLYSDTSLAGPDATDDSMAIEDPEVLENLRALGYF